MTRNHILVTGASGTIGSALVAELRARGADFATLSSRAAPGSVQGDFADPASLARAFEGVDTLFLLLPLVPAKRELARHALQAAGAAGVRHIVRSSGAGADAASPQALSRLQGEIDALVAASGIPHTLLRPNIFMQNWLSYAAPALQAGHYSASHGDGAQSVIDVRDIAAVAATVLADPAAHAGQAYTLTGPEALTDAQMVAQIAAAAGHPISCTDLPEAAAREAMAGMPAVMVDWLMSLNHVVRQGWAAGLTDSVQQLTGRPPRRFADFVAEHADAWR